MNGTTVDIKKYIKKDKDLVISIRDVDYLLDDQAVEAMRKRKLEIPLIHLYDGRTHMIPHADVENALFRDGVTDYLDKRD